VRAVTSSVGARLRGRLARTGAAVSGSAVPGQVAEAATRAAALVASSQVKVEEVRVSWRPSRHARRLLTLAATGLLLAVVTRNAALAGVAGPPLLLLGMARAGAGRGSGRGAGRPGRVSVRIGLTATRVFEGEPAAVDVTVKDAAGPPQDGEPFDARHGARWTLEPGKGIEPGSATAVNGPAARFTFEVPRWGKRGIGSVALTLYDQWHLAEGRVTFSLPSVD
jgi:hypothetical protein